MARVLARYHTNRAGMSEPYTTTSSKIYYNVNVNDDDGSDKQ